MAQGVDIVCTVDGDGNRAQLSLRGSVGILHAQTLVDAARDAARARDVVVDLGAAEHLDTSAWQVLLSLRRTLERRDGTLTLDAVPPGIARFLSISGLDVPFRFEREVAPASVETG